MASTAVSSNGFATHPTSTDDAPPSSSSNLQTPVLHPAKGTAPDPPPPLNPDQSAKYDSLFATVTSWTSIPTSSANNSPKSSLTDDERLWLTRECLLRYLRAAKWSLPDATKRLLATLVWRREYFDPTHDADYFSPENETGKCIIYGWDKAGRTCVYLNPAAQNTTDEDKQTEHLFFILERCIELLLPGQEMLTLLVNFKGGKNPSVAQGRKMLSILQTHYPERLGKALFINLPWLFWIFFKIINPFIDPWTREKIKFDQDLNNFVPSELLMKPYGGEVDFVYNHQIYWPALLKFASSRREEYVARWVRGGKKLGESELYLRGGEERGEEEKGAGGQSTGDKAAVVQGVA
ncbi:hypothetical protein MMC07_001270 [Pseudocyphellaria aurata]|nr:hypothetical protein [Pseudocyphellaria aurata]